MKAYPETSPDSFERLLRDLARRNLDREPITRAEIATVVEQYDDLVAEALDPAVIAEALRDTDLSLSDVVTALLRRKTMGYIRRDLERTRRDLRQEELEDKVFA